MTKTVDTNNFSSYNSSPYDIVDTDSDEFVDFDADFLITHRIIVKKLFLSKL